MVVAGHGPQLLDGAGHPGRRPLVGVLHRGLVVVAHEHVGPVHPHERGDVGQRARDAGVDLVGRAVDERRGHPGEQVLEGQALAQGVERVAPVLGVAQDDGAVAHRVERRPGVDEQQRLAPSLLGVAEQGPGTDLVVPVAAGQLGQQLGALVVAQQADDVLAQDLVLIEAQQGVDGRAHVADGPVGGHGHDHVAHLRQRLVELDAGDQRADPDVRTAGTARGQFACSRDIHSSFCRPVQLTHRCRRARPWRPTGRLFAARAGSRLEVGGSFGHRLPSRPGSER